MFCPNAVVWGDVGTWVGGGATFLTLTFAIYQWWQRWRTDQASRIYAWIARDAPDQRELRIGNGSGLPVYDVFIYYLIVPGWPEAGTWELFEKTVTKNGNDGPPGPDGPEAVALVQVLPPGDFTVEKDLSAMQMSNRADLSPMFGIDLVFRDGRNRVWTRRSNGTLRRNYRWMDHPRRHRRIDLALQPNLLGSYMFSNIVPVPSKG